MTKHVWIGGDPIAHSRSPELHNAGYQALGLDYHFDRQRVAPADLSRWVDSLRGSDCAGAVVTAPHKQAVLEYLDEVEPRAASIGAVNTIVHRAGRLVGYNTDAGGFIRSLQREGWSLRGWRVVVLGAGGAARAVIFGLQEAKVQRISLMDADQKRAQTLAAAAQGLEALGADSKDWRERVMQADLVINATPVGMHPSEAATPLPQADWIQPGQKVVDLIYAPAQTVFLRSARQRGAQTLNGRGMLLFQAVEAFHLLTGVPLAEVPVAAMQQVLDLTLPNFEPKQTNNPTTD